MSDTPEPATIPLDGWHLRESDQAGDWWYIVAPDGRTFGPVEYAAALDEAVAS